MVIYNLCLVSKNMACAYKNSKQDLFIYLFQSEVFILKSNNIFIAAGQNKLFKFQMKF